MNTAPDTLIQPMAVERDRDLKSLRRLAAIVSSDVYAAGFQTISRYRAALLGELATALQPAPLPNLGAAVNDLMQRRAGRDA